MKVNGTGPGVPPVDTESVGATETAGAAGGDKAESTAALKGSSGDGAQAAPLSAGSAGARAPEMARLVADISADLKAGQLSADAALEKLVHRILDRQVGVTAPPAVRASVEAALRDTLQNDPLVSAQLSALRRRQG